MKYVFNALTGKFDLIADWNTLASTAIPVTGFIMTSPSYEWQITINDTGTLIATQIGSGYSLDFSSADNSFYLAAV